MTDLFYCDWCAGGEKYEEMDTVVYFDHVPVPNATSIAHICQKCADLYDAFVASRDDK